MSDYAALTPINILTGFLGSGKTTLLQRLLTAPELAETAVLVNEFGEVGLDHRLLQPVAESTLLLENGCLCCAVRGDLQAALRDLLGARSRGDVPYFRRVVIETSGLADPVPIVYTLLAEAVLQHHFRLGAIVATVDAINAMAQLDGYPEAVKQVAVADRLVLTKTDLAEPGTVLALHGRLAALNASAPIRDATPSGEDIVAMLADDPYDAAGKQREVAAWTARHGNAPLAHSHGDDVHSFALTFDAPLDWSAFGVWLSMLLNRHGEHVLRVKGLLNLAGLDAPVLINGVQHIVHPPSHLEAWPDTDRRSHIVVICKGLARERLITSLRTFNALANPRPLATLAARGSN